MAYSEDDDCWCESIVIFHLFNLKPEVSMSTAPTIVRQFWQLSEEPGASVFVLAI